MMQRAPCDEHGRVSKLFLPKTVYAILRGFAVGALLEVPLSAAPKPHRRDLIGIPALFLALNIAGSGGYRPGFCGDR
jgi:hypothetical protein